MKCKYCKKDRVFVICGDKTMTKYICNDCNKTFRVNKAGQYIDHKGDVE